MVHKTELQTLKQQVLIVDRTSHEFLTVLKRELKKYDNEVFVSPSLPSDLARFDLFYLINDFKNIEDLLLHRNKKKIFIFVNQKSKAHHYGDLIRKYKHQNVKIINIENSHEIHDEEIEKILWFSFAKSDEIFLNIHSLHEKTVHKSTPSRRFSFSMASLNFFLNPKKVFVMLISAFIVIHTLFLPALLTASIFHYQGMRALQKKDVSSAKKMVEQGRTATNFSKNLYSIARPTFLLFGAVVLPDNLHQINDRANNALTTSIRLGATGKELTSLLFQKYKTPEEKKQVARNIEDITRDTEILETDLSQIYQKIPDWIPQLTKAKANLKEKMNLLATFSQFLPYTPSILAENTEKNYLLIFANNMEIRPGGGFIGSFGVLTVKDYSIENLKVYDVYDADGQLKVHIDPPKPIATYLNQPHWFLRDSAFTPDFEANYRQALFFLEKEMGLASFDGGMLITTTAIQNILSSMGNLYIPDFKEVVNKDNFYLKAQLYAEKGFFPGSLQKKKFLSSVMDQLLMNVENVSPGLFMEMLKKSLDEKQLTMYFDDATLQNTIDSLYWSGRMIKPTCASTANNCIVDYLFTVDANLGVNKANFFVNRSFKLHSMINTDGTIYNTLKIVYKNDSPNEAFPGGNYKNYAQIIVPKNSVIKSVTKNDTLIENFDETNDVYKTIGFLLEVKPQTSAVVEVQYQLPTMFQSRQGVYQLVIQKQIGSPNSDFELVMTLPKNVFLINQNFSALVKDNTINYNTTLTADKIFYIDLIRE